MPSVNFVLPHWLYWSGLLIFPLIAMILSRRQVRRPGRRSLPLAYFIWLVGGFLGLHRFYLRNPWGFIYWPLFAIILYSSAMERQARIELTDARAEAEAIVAAVERTERRLEKSRDALEKARATYEAAEDKQSVTARRALRTIEKEEGRIADGEAKLAELAAEKAEMGPRIEAAVEADEAWSRTALWTFYVTLALLAADALMLPRLYRRAEAQGPDEEVYVTADERGDDWKWVGTGWPGLIDRLSLITGEFVAFWSVIAVFVYYYEVVVRYVFNSPTNWAHEGMFLMFGMQYLIAGAYAMLTESHVRVDIFYARFSARGKALVDLLTSVFFFIFAGTLLVTGWIFARDSIAQGEVSFTEWAIQYWPVKSVIVLGAALLLLQGISKFAKDLTTVLYGGEEAGHGA